MQFLKLGYDHILDPSGYDHILFVMTLCAVFAPKDWKKVLILVTAFTVGHSLTLALAGLKIVKVNSDFIEFLIPLTIAITAILNVLPKRKEKVQQAWFSWHYVLALGFGLIHGLGFSNYFGMLMGKNADIVQPLFLFNLGVELGQIVIVLVFMALAYVFLNFLKVPLKNWTLFVSGAGFGIALSLMMS